MMAYLNPYNALSRIDETAKRNLNMTCIHPYELARMVAFLNRDVLNVTRCVVFSIIQDGGSGDSKGKSKHSKTNKNTVFKEKK